MNLSPSERKEILDGIADRAAARFIEECGRVDDCHLIPVPLAAKMLSVQARTVREMMPTVRIGATQHRVRMSDVRSFIASRTTYPENHPSMP